MNYKTTASSTSGLDGKITIRQSTIQFGTKSEDLPNPAEMFLSAFSACILKNVERFSTYMRFNYNSASLEVEATRLENPPRIDNINYALTIYSSDKKLNIPLLKKNIEKHGTIYNTAKIACDITGTITQIE